MLKQKICTEKIVFGGDCIAKVCGKTIFVPFALPNETLLVEITESHKDYDRAKIIEILEPSPHRVTPICPLYEKCGGCNFMHCESIAQKNFRKQILKDCFLRAGILEKDIPEIQIISGPDFGYRARFQFTDGGLLERGTKNVIPIEKCFIAEDAINNYLHKNNYTQGRIHVFGSKFTDERVTVGTENTKNYETKKNHSKIKKPRQIFSGTIISPENTATVTLNNKKISFDVRGFFQSNMFVLEKALPEICNFANDSNVVDIYSGCGVFSVFLAERAQNIMLVEHNRDALVFAEKNLSGIKHTSYGLSGKKWAEIVNLDDFENIVIDPPRSGIEKEVLQMLCKKMPNFINAVSCNPSTHARDIATFVKNGYKIDKLFLLDFYPQTNHVESFAKLTKN